MYMDLLIIALNALIGINCIYQVIVKHCRKKKQHETTTPSRTTDDSK